MSREPVARSLKLRKSKRLIHAHALVQHRMIIATHQRDYLLEPLLQHLMTEPPPSLKHISLVWQNIGEPLPSFLSTTALDLISAKAGHVVVTVRESKRNSMNERFRPIIDWGEDVRTKTVMIMDDDVVLRKDMLEWAYQAFKDVNGEHLSDVTRGKIVGFAGREVDKAEVKDGQANAGPWRYVVQPQKTYSLVLSNAAFLKTAWLERYWADTDEMRMLRDYVDEGEYLQAFTCIMNADSAIPLSVFNCDDLLINYLVSNLTREAPLLLQPRTPLRTIPARGLWNRDLGDSGYFDHFKPTKGAEEAKTAQVPASEAEEAIARPDHWLTRPVCLAKFHDHFARYAPPALSASGGPRSDDSATYSIQIASHFPLISTSTSLGQNVVDRARWLKAGESWQDDIDDGANPWAQAVVVDEGDEEEDGDIEDLLGEEHEGEPVGAAEFEALMDGMTDDEAKDFLRQLEELGELGEEDGEEVEEGHGPGGLFGHLADEL